MISAEAAETQAPPQPGDLPDFKEVNTAEFKWGTSTKNHKVIIEEVNKAFEAVVHFRKNLFKLPSGKPGKQFVTLKAKYFQAFAAGEALEQVAMKALAIMEHLLLQKIKGHKSKQHSKTLELRLQKWEDGKLLELLDEAQGIQDLLSERQRTNPSEVSRIYEKLILEGNVSQANNF